MSARAPVRLPTIAVTAGEPAGIGPDLCLTLLPYAQRANIVILADPALLMARARQLSCPWLWRAYDPDAENDKGIWLLPTPLAVPATAGQLDARNAGYVLRTLEMAADGCLSGQFDALLTAPVHKGILNEAGIPFTGHTEFLAARAGAAQVVMLLASADMRVALATTHLALKDVPARITRDTLDATLRILHDDLRARFGIAQPRIAVAGLNPHAGEGGHLGREEIDVIAPAIATAQQRGWQVSGPYPADTLFLPEQLKNFDAVLAMYHDQGLPVFKHAHFDSGVNVTLGLPFIRTSVDHGTALARAGTGDIDTGSFHAALELALALATQKMQTA